MHLIRTVQHEPAASPIHSTLTTAGNSRW
jgi:hypothetical protein